jgi:hypothetical protein
MSVNLIDKCDLYGLLTKEGRGEYEQKAQQVGLSRTDTTSDMLPPPSVRHDSNHR